MPVSANAAPPSRHDLEHVEERLDVVDRGRLPEQADLDRERRLRARLAAVALDRLEERRLLAADVCAGADPELELESVQLRRARVDRVLQPLVGERVLGADVEEAAFAARREARDRHRLDHRERIRLHQHAVLERAGLRLVGVADDVVRASAGWSATAFHFTPGRERGAPAAEQTRLRHLADDAVRPELAGACERAETAGGDVRVERRRVDARGDAAQQAQARRACLRQRRRLGGELLLERLLAGDRAVLRRRALAEPEARARMLARPDRRALERAGEVGADVGHVRGRSSSASSA